MTYVDGFVIPIKTENLDEYKKISEKAGKIWMKHGALAYLECKGDDLQIEGMKTQFPELAKCKAGETVLFSYITYRDKTHRDEVNKAVMADPGMEMDNDDMPFEVERMAYGGFEAFVEM